MTKFYAQEKQVFDINKVTVVGSPTITSDGVVSGFSGSDYVNSNLSVNSNNVKLKFSFNYKSSENQQVWFKFIGAPTANNLTNLEFGKFGITGNMYIRATINGTANTYIYATNSFSKTWADGDLIECEFDLYIDNFKGQILNKTQSTVGNINYIYTTNELSFNTVNIGGYGVAGSIDLTQFSITVDGALVYSPTKPVYALERRKEGFDLSKFTVVGSPTITEAGVVSGFSGSDYLYKDILSTANNIKINFSFIYKTSTTMQPWFKLQGTATENNLTNFEYGEFGNKGNMFVRAKLNNSASYTYFYVSNSFISTWTDGDVINCEFELTLNRIIIKILNITKSNSIETTSSYTTQQISFNRIDIGASGVVSSIDLPSFSITVDGKEVFTGAKEKFYAMRGM